jgi:hypothetical protein
VIQSKIAFNPLRKTVVYFSGLFSLLTFLISSCFPLNFSPLDETFLKQETQKEVKASHAGLSKE